MHIEIFEQLFKIFTKHNKPYQETTENIPCWVVDRYNFPLLLCFGTSDPIMKGDILSG